MLDRIASIPWWLLLAGSLTLGLAPFQPMPHLFEKLIMLANGELSRPIDILDLVMHAAFPVLLLVKTIVTLSSRPSGG